MDDKIKARTKREVTNRNLYIMEKQNTNFEAEYSKLTFKNAQNKKHLYNLVQ